MKQLYKACAASCTIVPLEGLLIDDKVVLENGKTMKKESTYVRISETWEEAYSFLEANLEVELNETRQRLGFLLGKQDTLLSVFKSHHGHLSHGVA